MKEQIKSAAMDFLTGVVLTALVFVVIVFVPSFSEEAANRLEFPAATGLFLLGGLYRGRKSSASPALTVVILNLFYCGYHIALAAFGIFALKAFFAPLVVFAFTALGVYMGRKWSTLSPQARATLALAPLVAVNFFWLTNLPAIRAATFTHEYNKPAPPFEFTSFDGANITADSLRGKVVVLDFWATWCMPCIKELPELQRFYDQYKNHPQVAFFAVNADQSGDTLEKAREFVAANGYQMPFAYDFGGRTFQAFEIRVLPGLVMLDKSGNLRLKSLGYISGTDLVKALTQRTEALLREE